MSSSGYSHRAHPKLEQRSTQQHYAVSRWCPFKHAVLHYLKQFLFYLERCLP